MGTAQARPLTVGTAARTHTPVPCPLQIHSRLGFSSHRRRLSVIPGGEPPEKLPETSPVVCGHERGLVTVNPFHPMERQEQERESWPPCPALLCCCPLTPSTLPASGGLCPTHSSPPRCSLESASPAGRLSFTLNRVGAAYGFLSEMFHIRMLDPAALCNGALVLLNQGLNPALLHVQHPCSHAPPAMVPPLPHGLCTVRALLAGLLHTQTLLWSVPHTSMCLQQFLTSSGGLPSGWRPGLCTCPPTPGAPIPALRPWLASLPLPGEGLLLLPVIQTCPEEGVPQATGFSVWRCPAIPGTPAGQWVQGRTVCFPRVSTCSHLCKKSRKKAGTGRGCVEGAVLL